MNLPQAVHPFIRRTLLQLLLVVAGILIAIGAGARPTQPRPRIGYLSLAAEDSPQAAFRAAFLSGMKDLGYVGSRAPLTNYKFAEGNPARLPGRLFSLASTSSLAKDSKHRSPSRALPRLLR